MTIGGSLVLIGAGAILKWAVTAHVSWIDLQTVGTILFVIGLVGLGLSLIYTFWWASSHRSRSDDATRVQPPPQNPPRYR